MERESLVPSAIMPASLTLPLFPIVMPRYPMPRGAVLRDELAEMGLAAWGRATV